MTVQRNFSRGALISITCLMMGVSGVGIFSTALPDWLRYSLCLVFSFVGGVVPATVMSLTAVLAHSPQQIGTVQGLFMQGANLGQFAGPTAGRERCRRNRSLAGRRGCDGFCGRGGPRYRRNSAPSRGWQMSETPVDPCCPELGEYQDYQSELLRLLSGQDQRARLASNTRALIPDRHNGYRDPPPEVSNRCSNR
jgi:hypothetical protein